MHVPGEADVFLISNSVSCVQFHMESRCIARKNAGPFAIGTPLLHVLGLCGEICIAAHSLIYELRSQLHIVNV